MNLLDEIKVILVETSHTGNMGSAARAMKTMGLSQLCLVNPIIQPDSQSISLAAGAHDLIKNVEIVKTLDEAVKDCQLIIGTSARSRTLTWPHLSSNEAGEQIISERLKGHKVALIFGRERVGLTNEELQKCHFHVSIPTNAEYGSLNLAMSVQILCYEVRQAFLRYENQSRQSPTETSNEDKIIYPTGDELEHFYHHLEETLQKTGFISREQPKQIMGRLRRLFTRARVEDQELNILRGILASMDQATTETKKPDQ